VLGPASPLHALRLNELVLSLHLGCTAEERLTPQEVRVSLVFRFNEPPQALHSDNLNDTICYARVSSMIQEHCQSREYNLIERVAQEVFTLVREHCGPRAALAVSIHKVRPPVPALAGGTIYQCGDFLP
jgi:7,8-dihydroneopterin aldolase/epimerase/oxygenase